MSAHKRKWKRSIGCGNYPARWHRPGNGLYPFDPPYSVPYAVAVISGRALARPIRDMVKWYRDVEALRHVHYDI